MCFPLFVITLSAYIKCLFARYDNHCNHRVPVVTTTAIFCLVAMFSTPVYAGYNGKAEYTHFTADDGLPSNYVYSIVEDRKGYIWILTDKGIVKYNGYSFTMFNMSAGLPTNDIWYLSEDSVGRLWIHTYGHEIGYIKDDKYHSVELPDKNVAKMVRAVFSNKGITYVHILVGKENFVCVFDKQRLLKRIPFDGRVLLLNLFPQILVGEDRVYTSYYYTPAGIKRKPLCGSVLEFAYSRCGWTSNKTIVFYSRSSDARAKEIVLANLNRCEYKKVPLAAWGADNDELVYLVYVKADVFYIVTNKSVIRLDKNFKFIGRTPCNKMLEGQGQITFQHFSKDGSQWISTKATGCFHVYKTEADFVPIRDMPTLKDYSYKGRSRDSVYWWYNEQLLRLMGLDKRGKVISDISMSNIIGTGANLSGNLLLGLSDNAVEVAPRLSIANYIFDTSKPVIVHNIAGSFYRAYVNTDSAGWERMKDGAESFLWGGIKKIHEYRPGHFYFLTAFGFMEIRYDGKTYRAQGFDFSKYKDLVYDSVSNNYFAYHENGILVLQPGTNKFTSISVSSLSSLGVNSISKLASDRFGNIYVYDGRSVLVVNLKKLSCKFLQIKANLTDSRIILGKSTVYIAGKFGVAYTTVDGPLSFSRFRIIPNIRSQNYNLIYDALSVGDSLLLNTDKGLFKLRSASHFTSATAFGHLVLTRPYQKRLSAGDTIKIHANITQLSIDYINYYGKGNRSITYRLGDEPLRESSIGEISLAELQPGKLCALTCSVKDELFKSNEQIFYVYRIPHWYQTIGWRIAFWAGGVLLFFSAILIAILITRKIIARANTKRSLQVELELRAIHSQINPHFIFNTLSSAQYFINKKDFEQAYLHISKFSKLLRLYLQSSRNRYTILSEEVDMLSKYIDLQKTRFNDKFEYLIEIDKRIPTDSIQIPSLLLQPLVENAINHGLFHREEGGLLQIRFLQGHSSDELLCFIEDNGIGRERSKEMKQGSEVYRHSYGSKLTEELIDLFSKYEKMNIQMEYIDKSAPDTGTIVKLVLRNMKYVV